MDVQLIKELSTNKISEKVSGIVKETQTLWKTLVNMLIIDSERKQQEQIINIWANKNVFLKD